ncbi:hypothetical protein BOTCAL_0003g00550 [Botryotinia calthae]|uniref:Uncharacterized protein n=1 Tax=Botryotinia calthae TaxID=38488 RepID=A0A4Y8DHV2_9HELO|nr:hypothetical protein BOTCAL_0003g00550 [Botryotinia calthae]
MFSLRNRELSPRAEFMDVSIQSTDGLLPGPKSKNPEISYRISLGTRYVGFLGLISTTIFSSLLLVADKRNESLSGGVVYDLIVENRASVQIVVQIIAAALGLVQVTALCRLFNYATRIRLNQRAIPLSLLNLWNGVSLASMRWDLHWMHILLLLTFTLFCAIPSALWAGAITPINASKSIPTTVTIPQYSNMTSVKEWPSEIDADGPQYRTEKGYFTYSPAMHYLGLLSQSLSTATTMDGSPRQHAKFDNSKYLYVGRSYGIGASVGLVDDEILGNTIATGYTFQEVGYAAMTKCIYNQTSDFTLVHNGLQLFAARGRLPDSGINTTGEYSVYLGHSTNSLVAIGVAAANTGYNPRYLAIAAGSDYDYLNTTQCRTEFMPSLFNVSVALGGRNITVTRASESKEDIEPSGNLTHVVERQFELASNDLTGIYQSVIGSAMNFSIADYQSYVDSPFFNDIRPTDEEINLTGIENSVTAMMDDLLVAYASAQLMIANDTKTVNATVTYAAVRLGQPIYVYSVFMVNLAIILIVTLEAVRTRSWTLLTPFDYNDLSSLASASSRGGYHLANALAAVARKVENVNTDLMLRQTSTGFSLELASVETEEKFRGWI